VDDVLPMARCASAISMTGRTMNLPMDVAQLLILVEDCSRWGTNRRRKPELDALDAST